MAKSLDRSAKLFARAQAVSPGGVHSPVRAFNHVDGNPLFIQSANGSRICDVDDNSYTDFCMAFGPLILGHRHPQVMAAAEAALRDGWSYGTAEPYSLQLAEFITDRINWIDSIRFVNSGTEAVMSALRLARAATGRNRILKFSGCYHGHADAMLVAAGSGAARQSASAGLPQDTVNNTLVAPLDDPEALEQIFTKSGHELAAVIIEPLPANHGLLIQRHEYLRRIADLCRQHGALLIFDEVITGFRLAFGGCAELFDIRPDIVTWGKIIGGGFPVGAYAARNELMQQVAPLGDVYQAGTLSANPLAMRAGLATLQALADGSIYRQLEQLGSELDDALANNARFAVQRAGSLFWIHPRLAQVETIRSTEQFELLPEYFPSLFASLLKAGIYFPPSPFEVGFMASAHSSDDIAQLADTLRIAAA